MESTHFREVKGGREENLGVHTSIVKGTEYFRYVEQPDFEW